MFEAIRHNLQRSISLYDELVRQIPQEALVQKLPGLRSSTVGRQLWCVVGARESYARAIEAGEWAGFSCSLGASQIGLRDEVAGALSRSGAALLAAAQAAADAQAERQERLIVDVLEHEAAHQGQLIRYLYALDLPIPRGWKARYALD